jgi:transcriptional regulator with XRE-family HTH domain
MSPQLFPALLRFWRKRRGLSQLDLALEAGISARHLSFLESGRARPSAEMVLGLMSALHVPLRAQNEVLRASDLAPRFADPALEEIEPQIEAVLSQMMAQHEPFPMVVLGGDFGVLRSNRGSQAVLSAFIAEPKHLPPQLDMVTLFFDQRLVRPFVQEWSSFALGLLNRLQRELLQRGGDERLQRLLDRILALPDVPASFAHPDFSLQNSPVQTLRLQRAELKVGFIVTVTRFSAPQQVALDELSVESCFPLDPGTRATCQRLCHER